MSCLFDTWEELTLPSMHVTVELLFSVITHQQALEAVVVEGLDLGWGQAACPEGGPDIPPDSTQHYSFTLVAMAAKYKQTALM